MKVLLLNGSPHENGCTYTALSEVASALNGCGVETELLWLGNGPVRGFGVTTCLGLVTSVFTAVYVTKVLILAWIKVFKPKQLNV